ncbi:MAG: ATPase [Bacilli bacterium]|jgi:MinD superfamily P-loop ATPase|nr:ATPase [Bacilli bacterium]
MEKIKIAVLSGKGGTGKTFIAVNLAAIKDDIHYLDCDVEEPNGNLFFQVPVISKEVVNVSIPVIDQTQCNGCRICSDFCAYHALIYMLDRIIVLDNLCHSCNGCAVLCPQKAITFKQKPIGEIEEGWLNGKLISTGRLDPSYPTGIPILKKMFAASIQQTQILDCPPGASCAVIECVKQADFCLVVAEDSLFGFHNFKMVQELINQFDKPYAVIINKKTNESLIEPYCLEGKIPVLDSILFDYRIAKLLSEGKILVHEDKAYRDLFISYLKKIEEIYYETTSRS